MRKYGFLQRRGSFYANCKRFNAREREHENVKACEGTPKHYYI